MIELIQFPWSPYCIVQRRILEFSRAHFSIKNIPSTDRSLIWKLTGGKYYGVPIIWDGKKVIFERDHDTQVIAEYLDQKLGLGLFPPQWAGLQRLLSRIIENDIEDIGFRLNDVYWKEMVPPAEQLAFLRHKERKFGRGCLDQWRTGRRHLLNGLTRHLQPFEEMLSTRPFLLDGQPRFVDFDLYGILGNFLYSGHYRLPASQPGLRTWHRRMDTIQFTKPSREKLRT